MTFERCPICYEMTLRCHQDENEQWHNFCPECGYNSDADEQDRRNQEMELANERAEACRETPLGEEIDGGNDWVADAMAAQYDDDPNPYHGTYSEE